MDYPYQLRIPGPTPVPDRVQRAMDAPMINHRGPEFKELLAELEPGMKWAFQTENDILFFPASGTGGLESAVQNLIGPGERVLCVTIGAFGDRLADVCQAFGADVLRYKLPWGEAADPEDIDQTLAQEPDVKTVFVTHNETSTGVTNPMEAIAAVVKNHKRLLVVDGVSSIGSIDLPVDKWGVDVAVTASQKGWMVPPGLTMLSVSPAAWERSKTAKAPRFYMDWAKEKKNQLEGATFTTPSLSIMFGLREGLKMLKEEGLPNVFRRHRRIAAAFRAALKALDIKLLAAPDYASPTVTAAYLPEKLQGDGGRAFFKLLRERYNLVIAGGQAQLHGKIFRIGHLGAVYDDDVIATITALEAGLKDLGLGPAAGKTGASALEIAKRALASAEPALIS